MSNGVVTDERSAGNVLESRCGVLELRAQSRDFAEGTEENY